MGNSNNAVSAYLLTWSSGYRGPDGPWQAISVNVGSDASGNPGVAVDLYPGGTLQTIVNSNLMCNGSTAGCLAASAGLYDPKNSTTAFTNITTVGGQTGPSIGSWGSANAMGLEGYAVAALDTVVYFYATGQRSECTECLSFGRLRQHHYTSQWFDLPFADWLAFTRPS